MERSRKARKCLIFVKEILHFSEMRKLPVSESLLLDVIVNNFWRTRQYNKMGRLIPRGTWDSDFKKENEEFMSCEFKLVEPEKLIKLYIEKHKLNSKLIEAVFKIYPQLR